MLLTGRERRLCHVLRDLPKKYGYRYTSSASQSLQRTLFRSLVGDNEQYLRILFKENVPTYGQDWSLRDAQGFLEGAEYSEGARGKACGHIFKNGDATYHCKTCTSDDTCVLCTRCFEGSDHEGHVIVQHISSGTSGCCDCGDDEAWRVPVRCSIHTADPSTTAGKQRQAPRLPDDLVESMKMTIGRAMDYMCDILSCSPENLRVDKKEALIKEDERDSYLTSKWYEEGEDPDPEYALLLWNDEKHTVNEVRDQVARACKREGSFGLEKANETNDIGRSVVKYSHDVGLLLRVAKIIEHIKITVTIRSSRDTFREQMCDTIIEWLEDIAGCSIGDEHNVIQQTVCEELLKSWRMGSPAINKWVGQQGLDEHEVDESAEQDRSIMFKAARRGALTRGARLGRFRDESDSDGRNNANDNDNDDGDGDDEAESQLNDDDLEPVEPDQMMFDVITTARNADQEMRTPGDLEDETEVSEATYAGYPPPPPPPPPLPTPHVRVHNSVRTFSTDSELGETFAHAPIVSKVPIFEIPRTPWLSRKQTPGRPPTYWLEQPEGSALQEPVPLHEDLHQRVRLDWLLLFDLRLWKRARVGLRDLYISTVVSVPQFKRILGLRFAGLYTLLAQLFLIADREPDYAIINLSLQMFTTPSIVEENVERANFLTNLIAILYTFLTHRQVGHPWDVDIQQTLAFDAGSVANRRMYLFFGDLKRLFENEYVQGKLRTEERYQLQFLDLIRLPQGICPNVRAVGDHVEYENDVWIGASLMTKEINKLCRQFADSFRQHDGEHKLSLIRAIRIFAKATIINSVGAERHRFDQAEIKHESQFSTLEPFFFERFSDPSRRRHSVINFVVELQPISFHHALHYTISWLIDVGKSMSAEQLRSLLSFSVQDLKEPPANKFLIPNHDPESYLMALFDFPLRVCAWLAQMKAGMWVRNGLSLRHQMGTYRGVANRDFGHHRDIFLLQTAMVICNPSRVLASMIDRFAMDDWMRGHFVTRPGFEPSQQLDVAEDLIHLLIVLLSDRISLLPEEDEGNPRALALRRDIAHILCFKPLQFSDLNNRLGLSETGDLEYNLDIVREMTNYKAPEGLSDAGLFELKAEYLAEVDPYTAHYTKNQRDEAEHVYRSWMAKRTGKPEEDIVLEPKLRPLPSGIFAELSCFTKTLLFAQVIFYSLAQHLYPTMSETPSTRIETFLQVVLHLVLAAVLEDDTDEELELESSNPLPSFVHNVLQERSELGNTIFDILVRMLENGEIKACHPKIRVILHRMQQRRPRMYSNIVSSLLSRGTGLPPLALDRLGFESPRTPVDGGQESRERQAKELKKKQALDRQAKVMAQFQQQQQNFMNNQDIAEWVGDDSDIDSMLTGTTDMYKQTWRYPSGNCILCQEETNDSRLFGTFSLMTNSSMFRQTNIRDPDFLQEVLSTPTSLDRGSDNIRPFGVAGQNRKKVSKLSFDGKEIIAEHQGLGKGFPPSHASRGPVSVGCGHIMHYSCFDLYCTSTQRRQNHQIARNHPECIDRNEFICPLCKALGNTFLPIIWSGKEVAYAGATHTETGYEEWLSLGIARIVSRYYKREEGWVGEFLQEQLVGYRSISMTPPLAGCLSSLSEAPIASPISPQGSSRSSLSSRFPSHDGFNSMTTLPSHQMTSDHSLVDELISIYRRMRETMKANELPSRFPATSDLPGSTNNDLSNTDTLAKILGNSIAATEIAQRGVQSDPGHLYLDKIPASVMTHLRILSETASSYIAIGGMRNHGNNTSALETSETTRQQLLQLFAGNPQISGDEAENVSRINLPSALSQDPFVFLAECSVSLVPAFNLNILHVVRLFYLLGLVKVSLHLMASSNAFDNWHFDKDQGLDGSVSHEDLEKFSRFLLRIRVFTNPPLPMKIYQDTSLSEPVALYQSPAYLLPMYKAVSAYTLTFLRKAAILLNVRYGVDYPDTGFSDIDEPELERLSKALSLPSLPVMLSATTDSSYGELTIQESMIAGWIQHWQLHQKHQVIMRTPQAGSHSQPEDILNSAIYNSLRLEHPAIFELIGLPKQYDTLIYEVTKRRCPSTGNRLEDAALCLFCGDLFCSQASCCNKNGKGGCNQHMQR
jgi:E3 ubiquitin-protein ligase UBR1